MGIPSSNPTVANTGETTSNAPSHSFAPSNTPFEGNSAKKTKETKSIKAAKSTKETKEAKNAPMGIPLSNPTMANTGETTTIAPSHSFAPSDTPFEGKSAKKSTKDASAKKSKDVKAAKYY